jgi:hypothetical protein
MGLDPRLGESTAMDSVSATNRRRFRDRYATSRGTDEPVSAHHDRTGEFAALREAFG